MIDAQARGLAAKVSQLPRGATLGDVLRANAQRWANDNPHVNAASTETLTVTKQSYSGINLTGLTKGWPVVSDYALGDSNPVQLSMGASNYGIKQAGDPAVWYLNEGGWVSLYTDAPIFALRVIGNGNSFMNINVAVDRQYTSALGYSTTTGSRQAWVKFDFSAATTPRRMRRIDVELEAGQYFGGVWTSLIDTVLPTDDVKPRIVLVGDSYSGGTGANIAGLAAATQSFRWLLAWSLGADVQLDWSSNGGSGYISGGTSNKNFSDATRIAGVVSRNPKLVLVAGGINDSGQSQAAEQAAAQTYLGQLRAAGVSAPILVLGAWPAATGPGAGILTVESGIQAAVAAVNDPYIAFQAVASNPRGSITNGTGRSGATNGTGNSDVLIGGIDGTDSTHPTNAGHQAIEKFVRFSVLRSPLVDLPRASTH